MAVDFKHLAYGIAEKSLKFFVSKEMYALKVKISDKLLTAFQNDVRRIDASDCSKTIFECVTQTILSASPTSQKIGGIDSIFEEEPDLVALLVQKSLKDFFRDFKEMILALTDKVHDFTPL